MSDLRCEGPVRGLERWFRREAHRFLARASGTGCATARVCDAPPGRQASEDIMGRVRVPGPALLTRASGTGCISGWRAAPALGRAIQTKARRVNPVLTKGWLSGIGYSGARVLACGPAFKRGHDNGLRPGRTRDPDKSRHYEAALSSIKSDDVATQGAQANDDRPRRRTSDPEFRADQGACGPVGPTARANRLALIFQACRGGPPSLAALALILGEGKSRLISAYSRALAMSASVTAARIVIGSKNRRSHDKL